MTHTQEPWYQNVSAKYPIFAEWTRADGRRDNRKIAFVIGVDEEAEANLRRIVACVNACAGISTEALEERKLAETLQLARMIADDVGPNGYRFARTMREFLADLYPET